MQLFALNTDKTLISAAQARKHSDYFCMECGKKVRKRGGSHRKDHFYHLKPDPACRQSQKSLVHLQVQWFIQQTLPLGEALLERRFPEISRIADVAWEKEKVIFEVQYSPISQIEVEQRNRDYASLGYHVVWILHDKRFNQRKVSAAEQWLQEKPHYFTNFDSRGNGEVYDQLQVIKDGVRRYQSGGSSVNLSTPVRKKNQLLFEGDFSCRVASKNEKALSDWKLYESERKKWRKKRFQLTWYAIGRWYLNLFNIVLEKCCKS